MTMVTMQTLMTTDSSKLFGTAVYFLKDSLNRNFTTSTTITTVFQTQKTGMMITMESTTQNKNYSLVVSGVKN